MNGTRWRSRGSTTVLGAVVVGMVLAGCGRVASESDDATASSDGGTTSETPATESGASETAAAEPLRVGFVNLEGGAVSLPEIRTGFEAAVAYVNTERGGVNGRPIEIAVSCNTELTPESSVNCANQMIEADVAVVFNGVDLTADAALPLYQEAAIPQIGVQGFSPGFNAAEGDVFTYLWASQEGLAGSLLAMQELGAERIVMALGDTPGARSYGESLIPELASQVGIEVEMQYYPPDVDWATFTQRLLANDPDAVDFPAISDQECLGMVPAMRSTGFEGPLHAGSCNIMLSVLDGPTLDGVVTHAEFTWRTMVDDDTPPEVIDQIEIYERAVGEVNAEYVGGFSMLGFGVGLFGADALSTIDGELTAERIRAGLPQATGTVPFSEIPFDCSGSAWPGTSSCRTGMIFTEINEDLTRTPYDWSPVDVSGVAP